MATEPRPAQRYEPTRQSGSRLADPLEAGVRKLGLSEYSKQKQELKVASKPKHLVRLTVGLLLLAVVITASYVGYLKVQTWAEAKPVEPPPPAIQLVDGKPGAMRISKEVVNNLGGRTVPVIGAPSREPLKLSGSLFVNPNRMVRVHARFAGEVISIGVHDTVSSRDPSAYIVPTTRPLQFGDTVQDGKVLAVIWSKEVGEKKSELVDAMSQLELDRLTVDRLRELFKSGSVSERLLREAERNFESDQILVAKLERTLLSWRLSEDDLEVVRAEAARIRAGNQQKSDKTLEGTWAQVYVRAPLGGVILEKNVTQGDIVSTDLDLFKIADLSRLGVMAYVYEEDVPLLESLPSDKRHWMIKLKAMPDAAGIRGDFEMIGKVVDPTQHTAVVIGWVDNKDGALRIGQFITASIELPADRDEVAVPDLALIEEGKRNMAFVATESASGKMVVTRRNIAVVRRTRHLVYVRSIPTAAEAAAGAEPLQAGELVVSGGTIELAAQLQELEVAAKIANK